MSKTRYFFTVVKGDGTEHTYGAGKRWIAVGLRKGHLEMMAQYPEDYRSVSSIEARECDE